MDRKIAEAFRILGLQSGASREEAKAAYRQLAREYHPDKVASLGKELQDLALKKMKEINAAYKRLEQYYDGEGQSHEEQKTNTSGSAARDQEDSKRHEAPGFVNVDFFDEQKIDDSATIEKLRAKVSQWAASIPHHDLIDLGSRMEIVSAFSRPAYYISLHSQYESRTLRQGQEPSTHISTPDLLKDSKVNVWTLPLQQFTQFKEFSEKYRIDDSVTSYGCPQCGGRLYLTCGSCGGLRTQLCHACGGHGKRRCSECDGGNKRCQRCHGSGQLETQLSSAHNYQRVMQHCPQCAGRGSTRCSACINGLITCNGCGGLGNIPCPFCFGEGQVRCDGCLGCGTITSYLYTHHKYDIRPGAKKILPLTFCESFAKSFSAGFEKNLIQEAKQLFEDIRSEWFANDFDSLRNNRLKQAAVELVQGAKTQEKQRSPFKGSHITQQKIKIFREDVACVEYRCYDKPYKVYVYGKSGTVWAENSPIHDVEKSRIAKAEALFKEKKYSEAVELTRKAVAMAPSNKGHQEFLGRILKKIKKQYLWGGAIGGTVTIPVAGTLLGVGVGNILNHVFADKVKTGKKRFFLSFSITVICDILIAAFVLFAIWTCSAIAELNEIGVRLKNYSIRKEQIESFGPVDLRMKPEYEWLKRKRIEESMVYEEKHKKVAWLGVPTSPFALRPILQVDQASEAKSK